MGPWREAGRRVATAANPTVSPAGYLDGDMDSKVPAVEEHVLDDKHLLKPWDAKKVGVACRPFPLRGPVSWGLRQPCPHSPHCPLSPQLSSSSSRPRSCEVPGIKYVPLRLAEGWGREERGPWGAGPRASPAAAPSRLSFLRFPSIFPSPDQPASVPVLPPAMNTGGSLPDLTNLHFPPPLPTPLDPEETAYPSLSGANSTSNLTHTMTHLGISGGLGLGPGYDVPGE